MSRIFVCVFCRYAESLAKLLDSKSGGKGSADKGGKTKHGDGTKGQSKALRWLKIGAVSLAGGAIIAATAGKRLVAVFACLALGSTFAYFALCAGLAAPAVAGGIAALGVGMPCKLLGCLLPSFPQIFMCRSV